MKYVLDTSVAIKYVIHEVDSDKAIRLIDEYANGIHDLIPPISSRPNVDTSS